MDVTADTAERPAAALRVAREYAVFARGTSTACSHLAGIEDAALRWLAAPQGVEPKRRALDVAFVGKLNKERDFCGAAPAQLAEEVLAAVAALATDSALAEQVLPLRWVWHKRITSPRFGRPHSSQHCGCTVPVLLSGHDTCAWRGLRRGNRVDTCSELG